MILDPLGRETVARRREYGAEFRSAEPFPHVVIDGFFDAAFLAQLIASFPPFERGHPLDETGKPGGKAVVEDIRSIDAAYARADDLFRSSEFAAWVSEVTGIPGVLYDPEYLGGGTHENRAGQDLDPHVDFNFHPRRGWHRRLNLIVYLNREWQESWGGTLELHSDPWLPPDENRIKRILPVANRAVLFETSERSWHGFERLTPPPGRTELSRKSLAIYLYTHDRPAAETAPAHSTVYVDRPVAIQLETGERPSFAEVERIERLLSRRASRLRFLLERDSHVTEEVLALAGKALSAGAQTPDDLALFERLVARQAALLKTLYQREKEWSRDLRALRARLNEGGFPLFGPAALADPPRGFHEDRWCGPELRFELAANATVATLTIHGEVPDVFGGAQGLRCSFGGQVHERELPAGPFTWPLPCALAAGERASVEVHAARCFCPARDRPGARDRRELSFLLRGVELSA